MPACGEDSQRARLVQPPLQQCTLHHCHSGNASEWIALPQREMQQFDVLRDLVLQRKGNQRLQLGFIARRQGRGQQRDIRAG